MIIRELEKVYQRESYDCVRASISFVLGIPYEESPHVPVACVKMLSGRVRTVMDMEDYHRLAVCCTGASALYKVGVWTFQELKDWAKGNGLRAALVNRKPKGLSIAMMHGMGCGHVSPALDGRILYDVSPHGGFLNDSHIYSYITFKEV